MELPFESRCCFLDLWLGPDIAAEDELVNWIISVAEGIIRDDKWLPHEWGRGGSGSGAEGNELEWE